MEMGEIAYGTPLQSPQVSVVGDYFCAPYPIDLTVRKKMRGFSDTHIEVLDITGNKVFQIHGSLWQLNKKRVMRDPAGFPVLTMREKALACRHRWTVHLGESSDAGNLLYSVQRSHLLQMRTHLDVFLRGNVRRDAPDFQVIGCYSSQSFRVYKGEMLIAEVKDKFRLGSFLAKGKESFGVRVHTGVDYASLCHFL